MKLFLKYFMPKSDPKYVKEVFHHDGEKGSLSCYITVSTDVESESLNNLTKFIWNAISDEFIESEGAILPTLKECLRAGIAEASSLLRNDKELVEHGVNFEMTLLSIMDGNLYVAYVGEHDIFVFRGSEKISIGDLLRAHKVKAGSAALQSDDVIFVTDNDPGIEWENPSSLLLNLQIDNDNADNDYGMMFLSQTVDFDGLINGKQSNDLLSIEEPLESELGDDEGNDEGGDDSQNPDLEVGEEDEIESSNPSAYLNDFEENSLDETFPIENTDTIEHNLENKILHPDQVTILEKPILADKESVSDSSGRPSLNASEMAKNVKPVIQNGVVKGKELLNKGIEGVGYVYDKVADTIGKWTTRGLNSLEGNFGRKPWFKRLKALMSQTRIGDNNNNLGSIRLGATSEKNTRNRRVFTVVLIVLGIVVAIWGYNRSQQIKAENERHDAFIAYQTEVSGYLESAENQLKSDADAAAQELANAKQAYQSLEIDLELLNKEDQASYNDLGEKLVTLEDSLYDRTPISKGNGMELFVDANLSFGSRTSPTDIAIKKDQTLTEYLYVVDQGETAVFLIGTSSGQVTRVADNDNILEKPSYIDVGVDGAYVYDEEAGVIELPYSGDTAELMSPVALSGVGVSDFGHPEASEFAIFTSSDNAYVLASDQEAILKAQGLGGGSYGLPYTYLSNETLSTSEDIFGDFSIYVLTAGSDGLGIYIYDYNVGAIAKSSVAVSGLKQPFEDLTAGYTGESLDNYLYVFDRTGKRFLIFEKPNSTEDVHPNQMLFVKELVYRGDDSGVLSDVKDIVVDATESYMYVLDGSKVWKIPL